MREATSPSACILAIDPGRGKCGLAVVTRAGEILARGIVPAEELPATVRALRQTYPVEVTLIGNGTGATEIAALLEAQGLAQGLELVDEYATTLRARQRYFADHPPRGLWRLIPLSLRTPPEPYDDYVAILLAEDYLAPKGERKGTGGTEGN